MLSIRIICVGKLGDKFWKMAAEEYEKRLAYFCKLEIIQLQEQCLPQEPGEKQISAALKKEASIIREKIPSGASVIAMCIEGELRNSVQFSETIGELTVSGTSRLVILIGGSYGLDPVLKQEAQIRLSMSPMTFPHHLARIMILEQIYRALNISAGGKYHK